MIRPVGVDLLEPDVIKMDLLQLVVSSIFFIRLCYVVLLDCITSSTVSVKKSPIATQNGCTTLL